MSSDERSGSKPPSPREREPSRPEVAPLGVRIPDTEPPADTHEQEAQELAALGALEEKEPRAEELEVRASLEEQERLPPDHPPPAASEIASPPDGSKPPAPRPALIWAKRIGIALGVLALLAVLAVVLVVEHFASGLPSTKELKAYDPPQVTRVLARDGTVLGETFTERRTVVHFNTIPTQVKLAVLAAEDAGFYEHAGLSYFGMLRALAVNIRSMRARQGAGTITQQVVRNVLLTQAKTLDRKMREIILARRIEQELTKDEIFELYLNHIYFGHARYGIEEACRYYFGKGVDKVSLAEAAMLAGIIKGPNIYSPRVDYSRAKDRQEFVLSQMRAKGFARAEQVDAAKADPIALAPETEMMPELAPEVVTEVRRVLREAVGPAAERGGYTVTTTIDPAMQAAARAAVRKNLDDFAARHKLLAPLTKSKREPAPFQGMPTGNRTFNGVVTGADDARGTLTVQVGEITGTVDLRAASRYNPKNLPPSKFAEVGKVVRVSLLERLPEPARATAATEGEEGEGGAAPAKPAPAIAKPAPVKLRLELGPQGALVAIDVRSREIMALVGSYEAVRAGLDRATNAHRQPGSTFKPFVYSYAIHARTMTPASILATDPSALGGYKPDNYDESEGKSPARLREALAHSVNVAAVWAIKRVGPKNVVDWAHALGIESKLGADESLALGSYEVTPREMAAAYATLAAGGVYEAPVLIQKITGPNGMVIDLPARPPSRRVMDEAEAYVVTSVLTSVTKNGTAKRASVLGRPIAGKTGTSNKAKDAWFVGYSPDVVCAVWTGNDDATPLGAGEAGATAALPAFIDFMREAHKKRPAADFAVPAGVTRVKIDPTTGLLAYPDQEDAIEEVFVAGTEPSDVASPDAGSGDPDAGVEAPPGDPADPSATGVVQPGGDPPPF